jgi:hypothetical protein
MECSVCYELFEESEIVNMKCKHSICKKCMSDWLSHSTEDRNCFEGKHLLINRDKKVEVVTCPVCKRVYLKTHFDDLLFQDTTKYDYKSILCYINFGDDVIFPIFEPQMIFVYVGKCQINKSRNGKVTYWNRTNYNWIITFYSILLSLYRFDGYKDPINVWLYKDEHRDGCVLKTKQDNKLTLLTPDELVFHIANTDEVMSFLNRFKYQTQIGKFDGTVVLSD